jgi:hypothetical protein
LETKGLDNDKEFWKIKDLLSNDDYEFILERHSLVVLQGILRWFSSFFVSPSRCISGSGNHKMYSPLPHLCWLCYQSPRRCN